MFNSHVGSVLCILVCACVCMYICMCIYICICIYISTYKYITYYPKYVILSVCLFFSVHCAFVMQGGGWTSLRSCWLGNLSS